MMICVLVSPSPPHMDGTHASHNVSSSANFHLPPWRVHSISVAVSSCMLWPSILHSPATFAHVSRHRKPSGSSHFGSFRVGKRGGIVNSAKNERKKQNHAKWKARMCGRANENRLILVSFRSSLTSNCPARPSSLANIAAVRPAEVSQNFCSAASQNTIALHFRCVRSVPQQNSANTAPPTTSPPSGCNLIARSGPNVSMLVGAVAVWVKDALVTLLGWVG
eukprot:1029515-Rhodomonas_salina.5